MKLPKITKKQFEILTFLYQYRFLNRTQIQTLLKHKDKKTINVWLKDLKANGYIDWIYEPDDFALKTKPAIYYLALNGIRELKARDWHPVTELNKRYRESSRSQSYIDRCLLLADCSIALDLDRNDDTYPNHSYYYETEADMQEESYYSFLFESEFVRPHLCFSKDIWDGFGEPEAERHYLLEVFDPGLPRYRMKKRLTDYVKYLDEESTEWEEGALTDKPPVILLVCATTTDLIYAKRRTRGLIADVWEEGDDTEKPKIQFTTVDTLKRRGMSWDIWEVA
jgi:hypothetical protein